MKLNFIGQSFKEGFTLKIIKIDSNIREMELFKLRKDFF